MNNTDPTK